MFNETGKSTLNIVGTALTPGRRSACRRWCPASTSSTTPPTNKTLAALNTASTTLRSQASSYGSNLSIVQIRQDFAKNLINVLQTGSSNLTLADTNEEAANSQALSTRQSIAVSALALANQSQQSVLQAAAVIAFGDAREGAAGALAVAAARSMRPQRTRSTYPPQHGICWIAAQACA